MHSLLLSKVFVISLFNLRSSSVTKNDLNNSSVSLSDDDIILIESKLVEFDDDTFKIVSFSFHNFKLFQFHLMLQGVINLHIDVDNDVNENLYKNY